MCEWVEGRGREDVVSPTRRAKVDDVGQMEWGLVGGSDGSREDVIVM